jgi:integrase
LEFCILTATRTNEVIGATWREINLEARTWTIPVERLKRRGEESDDSHTIPLSDRAVEIVRYMDSIPSGDRILPGADVGAAQDDATQSDDAWLSCHVQELGGRLPSSPRTNCEHRHLHQWQENAGRIRSYAPSLGQDHSGTALTGPDAWLGKKRGWARDELVRKNPQFH